MTVSTCSNLTGLGMALLLSSLVVGVRPASGQTFEASHLTNNGSFSTFISYRFGSAGGRLFFAGVTGMAQFAVPAVSDGTLESTLWLGSFPVNASTTLPIDPDEFVQVGNEVFFSGLDAVNGRELWKTSLTTLETTLVKDIRTGSASASPRSLVELNGKLLFVANPDANTVSGEELWISDGTESGTVMLKDVMPGADGSDISRLQVAGDLAYFGADRPSGSGDVLWRTDGTSAGTFLLKDTGITSQFSDTFTQYGGATYFFTRDEVSGNAYALWRTDGSSAGTYVIKSPVTGASSDGGVTRPSEMRVANGLMFFRGGSQTTGYELWRSDGTTNGTYLVKDIFPGNSSGLGTGSNTRPYLTTFNNQLFFAASNGSDGRQLWRSDGASGGTVVVENVFNASSFPADPRGLIVFQGLLFFRMAKDAYGWEWFSSDGSSISEAPVVDVNPGPGSGIGDLQSSFSSDQVVAGDSLYFTGFDPSVGIELWHITGSAGEVTPQIVGVTRPGAGLFQIGFTGVQGRVYQVRVSSDLSDWEDLGDPFVCLPGVNVLPIATGATSEFWMVEEVP